MCGPNARPSKTPVSRVHYPSANEADGEATAEARRADAYRGQVDMGNAYELLQRDPGAFLQPHNMIMPLCCGWWGFEAKSGTFAHLASDASHHRCVVDSPSCVEAVGIFGIAAPRVGNLRPAGRLVPPA